MLLIMLSLSAQLLVHFEVKEVLCSWGASGGPSQCLRSRICSRDVESTLQRSWRYLFSNSCDIILGLVEKDVVNAPFHCAAFCVFTYNPPQTSCRMIVQN